MNVTYNPKEMKKRFFAPVTHPAPGRRTAGSPAVKKQAPGSQKPAITEEMMNKLLLKPQVSRNSSLTGAQNAQLTRDSSIRAAKNNQQAILRLLTGQQQGEYQLQNTGLRGKNALATTGAVGENQQANILLQGKNQLANTNLQGQNQQENTMLQGKNTLANTNLQAANTLTRDTKLNEYQKGRDYRTMALDLLKKGVPAGPEVSNIANTPGWADVNLDSSALTVPGKPQKVDPLKVLAASSANPNDRVFDPNTGTIQQVAPTPPAFTPEEYAAAMTSLNQAQDDASAEKYLRDLMQTNPALAQRIMSDHKALLATPVQ